MTVYKHTKPEMKMLHVPGQGRWPREYKYKSDRHGQRLARKEVSQYFNLHPGHVIHHKDKDTSHNVRENLVVFACQGDHIRYHRGFPATALWDGARFT